MFSTSTFSLANIVFFLDNTKDTPFFLSFFTFVIYKQSEPPFSSPPCSVRCDDAYLITTFLPPTI